MCAIFGVLDYRGKLEASQRAHMVRILGNASEIRGTDATGIAFFQRDKLCIQKAPKPAHKMKFRIPAEVRYIMGHTRMTTQGDAHHNQNNHPFSGIAGHQKFALAHNGVLINDKELKISNQLPETDIETDTFVAVQLIEKQKCVCPDSLKRMAEVLEGHFTFTILDQDNNLYFIKGNNPLTIYHYPKLGIYLYASTEEILRLAVWSLDMDKLEPQIIEPDQGTILCISRTGQITSSYFDDSNIRTWWLGYNSWREDDYWSQLYSTGERLGIPRPELEMFFQAGYSVFDVEDLLYDDEARKFYLEEIRREVRNW